LKVGTPKTFQESKPDLNYIRKAGVKQFISTYQRVQQSSATPPTNANNIIQQDELLWGDEIEYGIFVLDHDQKKVRLSLRSKEVRFSTLPQLFGRTGLIPNLFFFAL
jgi:glutamate--cysteine ligase catalytic subunit